MAIKTSTLGGVTLTGSAAKAFRKQFLDTPPARNMAAEAALARGVKMLKEFEKNGYSTVKIIKK